MLLGLKYFDKMSFIIFTRKRELILLLQVAASDKKIWYTYENINQKINNSIKISKLYIIRKKKGYFFKLYTSHVHKFWQVFKISNHDWVAFFSEIPCKRF